MHLDQILAKKLAKRIEEDSFRTLKLGNNLVDFSSNDYLGLARSTELSSMIFEKIVSKGLSGNGATGSRLLSGNSQYVVEIENKLAEVFQGEAALIFNSGYTANLAALSTIPQKGDTILYDELSHACIKDGARLSLATRFAFRHNDMEDLEKRISKSTGRCFIAIESIYSMDGDEAPLKYITELAEKYHASLIIDEAHSTGLYGPLGSGKAVEQNLQSKFDVRIYTFGKGMGIHGACIVGTKRLIEYLINFARPFIYTTALPPHSIAAIDSAFEYLNKNIILQKNLQTKIDQFINETSSLQNKRTSRTAIQTLIVPGNKEAKAASTELMLEGFDIRPILSPTVAKGTERLRICLHTYNTDQEINKLTQCLAKLSSSM